MASIEGNNRNSAGRQFVVVVAIEQPVGTAGARSTDGERKRSAGRDFAAGAAVEEAVGIGFLGGARRESGQLNEVAAIQGELGDLLLGDDLPQAGISGLHGDFCGAYFDLRCHGSGREGEVHFAMLIHLQLDIFLFGGLEARELRREGCSRRREAAESESVLNHRFSLREKHCGLRSRPYGGSRHDRSGLVSDRASKTAGGLAV